MVCGGMGFIWKVDRLGPWFRLGVWGGNLFFLFFSSLLFFFFFFF